MERKSYKEYYPDGWIRNSENLFNDLYEHEGYLNYDFNSTFLELLHKITLERPGEFYLDFEIVKDYNIVRITHGDKILEVSFPVMVKFKTKSTDLYDFGIDVDDLIYKEPEDK